MYFSSFFCEEGKYRLLVVEKLRLEAKPPDPSEIIYSLPTTDIKPFPWEQLVTGRPLTFCLRVQTYPSSGNSVGLCSSCSPPPGALLLPRQAHPCGTGRTLCPQLCGSQHLSRPSACTKGCRRHHCSPEQDQLQQVPFRNRQCCRGLGHQPDPCSSLRP